VKKEIEKKKTKQRQVLYPANAEDSTELIALDGSGQVSAHGMQNAN